MVRSLDFLFGDLLRFMSCLSRLSYVSKFLHVVDEGYVRTKIDLLLNITKPRLFDDVNNKSHNM